MLDKKIQALVDDFEALLAKSTSVEASDDSYFAEGDVVEGKVVGSTDKFLLIDIGYKSEGRVSKSEFAEEEVPAVGDVLAVFVDDIKPQSGLLFLSKEKADRMKVWDEIETIAEGEGIVSGTIVGKVKGGLSVDIGIKAFLPGSQVDLRPIKDLGELIGETYEFKILKHNRLRNNIVLSRRQILEEERAAKRSETLAQIDEGVKVLGVVKNITDYGAFIDLGGVDGLLHITDMSWGRINHPSEVVNVGDEIDVIVLSYDSEKERVSLGLKQTKVDPWDGIDSKYPVGSRHEGKVVSIADYGAFVELEVGIEGLVHVSELSWTEKNVHPSRIVSIDEEVSVSIQNIDMDNRRISLSIRETQPNPWLEVSDAYQPGTVIEGEVKSITDFGVFVGIRDGIDGLVHISDMSWTKRIIHPKELFKKGDTVQAVVLNVDVDAERFSLGIRQLQPNPWDHLLENFPPGTKIPGKVTQITDFGLFVEIYEGIEGLVHVSELDDTKPKEEYTIGDEIEVRVQGIDALEHKVSLSAKKDVGSYESKQTTRTISDLERQIKENVLGQATEQSSAESAEAPDAPAKSEPSDDVEAEADAEAQPASDEDPAEEDTTE